VHGNGWSHFGPGRSGTTALRLQEASPCFDHRMLGLAPHADVFFFRDVTGRDLTKSGISVVDASYRWARSAALLIAFRAGLLICSLTRDTGRQHRIR